MIVLVPMRQCWETELLGDNYSQVT